MQEFYINKNATLPVLKMELINNGRYDYNKFYELIQNADIKFSMIDYETGITKIANKQAYISLKDTCEEEYYICYFWDERDTKMKGKFKGLFTIKILDPENQGTLIVPIQEELLIYVL